MTPRERVIAALRGEWANKVPFTAYCDQVPRSEAGRRLRNGGLCLIDRQAAVHRTVTPNVSCERVQQMQDGKTLVRTSYRTAVGELAEVEEYGPRNTRWHVKRLFTGPEDYPALRALYADQQFLPDYDGYLRLEEELGGDVFLKPEIGYSPMHQIMYSVMGIELFAEEWSQRQDEVLQLYETLTENRRRLYPVVAASPAVLVTYCGNLSPAVIGLKRFEEYYAPHYDEFAAAMHANGKLASTQFDSGTWLLEEPIGLCELDCVESFLPPPDGDMTVAQARTVWHDKVLWVSMPPSLYLGPRQQLEDATRQLLRESASGIRFLLGVTENLPQDGWQESLLAIMRVINTEGQLPLS